MAVLEDLQSKTKEELIAQLIASQAQAQRKLTLKIAPKTGAVSLYHGSRFPVTLYAEQWERVLGHADAILAFIKANAASVSRKSA